MLLLVSKISNCCPCVKTICVNQERWCSGDFSHGQAHGRNRHRFYDIRDYLDKQIGTDISDEIFDVITKYEDEYKKENKNLEEYSRYTEQMEESVGNLSTCLDKIEVSLRNIESILLSASVNKKISNKLYKEVMGEMNCIKEYINDVDEDR